MLEDISVEQLLAQRDKAGSGPVLIDVRSPHEFEESTIPGSINIPLFNNEERIEIGTLYKQVSVEAAKDRGLEIVSAKLPDFIRRFAAIPGRKIVFCWRGGMRSRTTATLLSLMGIHAFRLSGGYRAFRRWVVETLEHFVFKPRAYVLNGLTGTGKTELLQRLADSGLPVLDLERMAGHRGSIFGHIGQQPNNQKTFEAQLALRLLELNDSPYVLMEAESKRIGKAVLPSFLVEAKERGVQLFLERPFRERIRYVIEQYEPQLHKDECIQAFSRIKRRMHTEIAAEIELCLQEDRFEEAVAMLLEAYYDPRYDHAGLAYPEEHKVVLRVETLDEAERLIREALPAI